jgi:hypothetical protein
VLGMVSTLARGMRLPVFVKIRLQATLSCTCRGVCAMRVPCVCHARAMLPLLWSRTLSKRRWSSASSSRLRGAT